MRSQSKCLGQSKVSFLHLGCHCFLVTIMLHIDCIFNSFTECKEMQTGICMRSVASSYQLQSATHVQLPVVFHTEQSSAFSKYCL